MRYKLNENKACLIQNLFGNQALQEINDQLVSKFYYPGAKLTIGGSTIIPNLIYAEFIFKEEDLVPLLDKSSWIDGNIITEKVFSQIQNRVIAVKHKETQRYDMFTYDLPTFTQEIRLPKIGKVSWNKLYFMIID